MIRTVIRYVLVLAQSALLAACAFFVPGETHAPVEYSAVQTIATTPGPFLNRIYVSGDRERQDASLGGITVTTIVRRDKGVAWLLIPAKQQYEEVALVDAAFASVQMTFAGLQRNRIGPVSLDGQTTEHYAYEDADGRPVAVAWVSADGIAQKTEIFADSATGKPGAIITLQDIRIGPQDAGLFELPPGYARRDQAGP